MKTEYFEVRVIVNGVKKRCRKVERHGFNLINAPLGTKDSKDIQEQYRVNAIEMLSEHMKEYSQATIFFQYGYEDSDKPDMKMLHPFDERNFFLKVEA